MKEARKRFDAAGGLPSVMNKMRSMFYNTLDYFCSNKYLCISGTKYSDTSRKLYPTIREEYKKHFLYADNIELAIQMSCYIYQNSFDMNISITYDFESKYSQDDIKIEKKFDIRDIVIETKRFRVFKKNRIKYSINYDVILNDLMEDNKPELDKYINRVKIKWDTMLDHNIKR